MRNEIENRIREDAAVDPDFRAALVTDPTTAVAQRYGVELPDGISIRVIEEAADEVALVLPAPHREGLSEAELQAAVGGDPYTNNPCRI